MSIVIRWTLIGIVVLGVIAGMFGAGAALAMGNTAGSAGGSGAASFVSGLDNFFESFKATSDLDKKQDPATPPPAG